MFLNEDQLNTVEKMAALFFSPEVIADNLFKLIIQAGDNNGLHRINPSWKETLIPIIDAALAGDFEAVRQLTTDLLNGKVDLPFADEEIELRMFDSFTRFIAAAIEFYVVKTRQQEETAPAL